MFLKFVLVMFLEQVWYWQISKWLQFLYLTFRKQLLLPANMFPLIICFEILESLLKISIKLLFFWELCNQYTNQPCDLLLSAILNWFTRVNTRVCNPLCVSYIQPQPSKALVCCHFSEQLIMAQQAKCICSNCNSTNSEEGWKETNVDGNTDEVDRSA